MSKSKEIMLGRLAGNGMFVCGYMGEGRLEEVYRVDLVVLPGGNQVKADFYPFMSPGSNAKADISLNHLIAVVEAPKWIADKYRELTSGISVAQSVPKELTNILKGRKTH